MGRTHRLLLCLVVALTGCQGGVLSRSVPAGGGAVATAPPPSASAPVSPTRIEYFQISDG